MISERTLPRWDMTSVFPSLSSPEYKDAALDLGKHLDELESAFAYHEIVRNPTPVPCQAEVFTTTVDLLNHAGDLLTKLRAYVSAHTTTDSKNSEALARESELDKPATRYTKLLKRFTAWLGTCDVDDLLRTEIGQEYAFVIEQARLSAEHQMETALEMLASDMEITSSTAWRKLYSNLTSQMSVTVELPAGVKDLPMSEVRGLANHLDRPVRAAAFRAELAAWRVSEVSIAAAMNAIKGETVLLSRQRNWSSPLEAALFGANVDAAALDAMLAAAREAFPSFRRYLRAKARVLGIDRLAFYDLFAPLPKSNTEWTYGQAMEFIRREFGSYSPKLGAFAALAFDESWIDAEPRSGKVDGAYCMRVTPGVSRILMNHKDSFMSVSTLAHELGHGYHNLCLKARPTLLRTSPMTLAETASIFCETIVKRAVLAGDNDALKLEVLEASLQGTTQTVVDIYSRYLFESAVLERRKERELSPAELCEAMADAQRQTYGDGLDPDSLHPYMWAAKPHYYGRSFYNFPYMFGLLFGLGLYRVYCEEGVAFQSRYDDLLGATGTADAATLAAGFGIDIRSIDFWRGSLAVIDEDVRHFEAITS